MGRIITMRMGGWGLPPGGGTGDVDLSGLPSSAAPDTTAYGALNVPGMSAGTAFSDPVTGVRTVKLTDSSTASGSNMYPLYSTQGLQISQAWGAGGDMYTIVMMATNGSHKLIDYQLGGSPSNYRTFSSLVGSGNFAFSRKTGEEQILYLKSGTQVRRYDTASNAYADTGIFPVTVANGQAYWFQTNAAHSYAIFNQATDLFYRVDLVTGAVASRTITAADDIYLMNNHALVNSTRQIWDLAADTLSSVGSNPPGWGALSHTPSLNGYWIQWDTVAGGGTMGLRRIDSSGTYATATTIPWYWGQSHLCGFWQTQGAGNNQYFLWSSDGNPSNAPGASNREYMIGFISSDTADTRMLGHSYSDVTSFSSGEEFIYYSQPHASVSHDGKLVIFGSNMRGVTRIDGFLMEVPRTA